MLAIPRAQVALAMGFAEPDAREFELVAGERGICSGPFLERAFRTVEFRIRVTTGPGDTWSYEEDTAMAAQVPSGSFVHAAHYASLWLQVTEHLFPGQKLFALSQDQRRIVDNETRNLLLQAKWIVDSQAFAEQFAAPPVGVPEAPAGTILGQKPPEVKAPGQYA